MGIKGALPMEEEKEPVSATQDILDCCPQSARFAHEMTNRAYAVGGNEGEFILHGEEEPMDKPPRQR